ncbi:phage tail protein [Novosphingobium umbonatum]|uniref:Phage tail protein n=1 Tax=Novosphingobium umbonatum TaxID=1908524 RepID=A0A3S2V5C8_9SPHN|nr:tail protein X [Novosphingobium umbonatum]RVU03935.1 phage tail protein [Novosphingobium umbonatum]
MGTITATALDGETVDEICWRMLGATAGVTEQVLALNAGLAAAGPRLPAGTQVTLPDTASAATATATIDIVQLWN